MSSEWQPIVDIIEKAAAAGVVAVVTWSVRSALSAVAAHFNAAANTAQQANYNTALRHALLTAIEEAAAAIRNYGSDHPEVRYDILNRAAVLLLQKFPQTARAVGVKTPADASAALLRVFNSLPVIPPTQGQLPFATQPQRRSIDAKPDPTIPPTH